MADTKSILVALSGGVDSAAVACLLRERQYHIIACTFQTRYTSPKSLQRAVDLANQLEIEHHIVDYSALFDQTVIHYFRDEYAHGRTPNPCVLCNRTIKFGALFKEAEKWGCEYISTGHYARIRDGFICRAADAQKDQTYFLWQIAPSLCNRIMFPLGDMTKAQVRAYMEKSSLKMDLSHYSESQDICFIQDDYRPFLQSACPPGPYILSEQLQASNAFAPSKKALPLTHAGYLNYTIGQRKGLGVALGEPAFVTHIDAATNQVTLGTHDELYTQQVQLCQVIFHGDVQSPVQAQIRYRSLPQEATLQCNQDNVPKSITFQSPVWAPAPGQSCVFYQGDRLVGGGIIA